MVNTPLEEAVPLLIQECQLSDEQVKQVEVATRGQHTNATWKDQRCGRLTASRFRTVSTKCQTLLKPRGSKSPLYSSSVDNILNSTQQISWGNYHEKDAVQAFMSDVASQHEDGMKWLKECGLFIKPGHPYLAGSPDGLFLCKCCGSATLEVKCP